MVASGIKLGLVGAGYAVDWEGSAERALEVTRDESFDIAIIALGLSGMEGLSLLQSLRKQGHGKLVFGPLVLDTSTRLACIRPSGQTIELRPRE